MLKLGIIGTGGLSLEIFDLIVDQYRQTNKNVEENVFFIDEYSKSNTHLGLKVLKQNDVDYNNSEIIMAIGNADYRKKILSELPSNVRFGNIIHPSSFISPSASIGSNVIISHNCVVSSKVILGSHSILNFNTCIGHETEIADFFTSAPGAKISGNCKIGESVYFGTNACIVQGKSVSSNVKIGIGTVVLNDIKKPGTYLFNPSKKIF